MCEFGLLLQNFSLSQIIIIIIPGRYFYSAIIYGINHMEFILVLLSESWSAPGGRQLIGQAANFTFESTCRLLYAEHSLIAICIIMFVL